MCDKIKYKPLEQRATHARRSLTKTCQISKLSIIWFQSSIFIRLGLERDRLFCGFLFRFRERRPSARVGGGRRALHQRHCPVNWTILSRRRYVHPQHRCYFRAVSMNYFVQNFSTTFLSVPLCVCFQRALLILK